MTTHKVTVSQVIHPTTNEVMALEIAANDGKVYWLTDDPFWEGMRVGPFPRSSKGEPRRVVIAALPATQKVEE